VLREGEGAKVRFRSDKMALCALVLVSHFEKYNGKLFGYGICTFECDWGVELIWGFENMILVRYISYNYAKFES